MIPAPDYAAAAFLLLNAASILCAWMEGDKDARAWRLGLVVQSGFLLWALGTGSTALVPLVVVRLAIFARNLWMWGKPETRPAFVQLESELEEAAFRYAALVRRMEDTAELNGRVRHDRAGYTRRLNTYAHDLFEAARAAGVEFRDVPKPPPDPT